MGATKKWQWQVSDPGPSWPYCFTKWLTFLQQFADSADQDLTA